jgi:predicted SAM-dependent methyltransferase
MYRILKQYVKRIVPEKFAEKNEMMLRSILYRFYKGKRYECPVCNKKLRSFIIAENGEKICPGCGSLPRNRRLWMLLKSEFLKDHLCILHFSPSKSLYRLLRRYTGINYVSTDISGDFLAQKHFDITTIDESGEKYDLIICYHILEHVEKDRDAIRELYRILRPRGICMIQTPFKKGLIYEDHAIKSPADRYIHYGQEDHVRIYSVNGLKSRLEQVGFVVKIMKFSEEENNYYGFKTEEYVLVARKQDTLHAK